eukprot:TRINITY_DN0_c0_g1_i4.p1 TRINITY_DN0_c0_g1~~TRINITY_DN0_c0_g1_i4.p1  ORF type:complete len:228 (+),score=24.70 TRINITY_DN0_c0_g1_i4:87-770(+)
MGKCACDCHCFGGCSGFTRILLLGINCFFMGAGILIVILGSVAKKSADQFEKDAEIFHWYQAGVSTAILIATGAGTIATSLVGFAGVYFRWTTCLKIYTIVMFGVCALQLAIGIFLFTRDVDTQIEDYWFDPTQDGLNNRVDYQATRDCCGWTTTTDSRTQAWGPTNCPAAFVPGYEWQPRPDGAWPPCRVATIDWVKDYIDPISIAEIGRAVQQECRDRSRMPSSA